MDEFPERDSQVEDVPEREVSDDPSPSPEEREDVREDAAEEAEDQDPRAQDAREVAEEAAEEEAAAVEERPEAPAPGMGGQPEEHDVQAEEQAEEASVTGFEEATEQQRAAVIEEMAEQVAEEEGEDAAPAAEEAAIETVGESGEAPVEPEEAAEPVPAPEPEEVPEPSAESAELEEAPPAEPESPPEETAEPEGDGERPAVVEDPFSGPGDWYVIHTYSGYENKVRANLGSRIQSMQMQDKIFDVVIPLEDVMEVKGGKKQVVQKKVFPGYLLVRMEYDDDSWYVVRNTPGVTGFVSSGTGQKPTPLPRHEVEKFLAPKEEEAKPQFRPEFEEGDVVRIITGPFADFNGTISEINVDQAKVKVMVNIFDRETPVELGFDQVARV